MKTKTIKKEHSQNALFTENNLIEYINYYDASDKQFNLANAKINFGPKYEINDINRRKIIYTLWEFVPTDTNTYNIDLKSYLKLWYKLLDYDLNNLYKKNKSLSGEGVLEFIENNRTNKNIVLHQK